MQKIRKAVFPVAGMGTRFLPATKATCKEMLPVVDKPLVQYAVEEAIAAGINQMIFVTSPSKHSIENHFDSNYELEQKLQQKGKNDLLAMVQQILPQEISCVYVRQQHTLGLGHAVLKAKDIIGNEPFAVMLADDLIDEGDDTCLKKMVACYEQHQSSVLAVETVRAERISDYGIVALNSDKIDNQITQIIEKPAPDAAPSNLGVVGRYILTPRIFTLIEQTELGAGGELQLTDAIAKLLLEETAVAYRITGQRYDCGSKLGYLQATINYALKHPQVGSDFKRYLTQFCQTNLFASSEAKV